MTEPAGRYGGKDVEHSEPLRTGPVEAAYMIGARPPSAAVARPAEDKSLERLYDYTKYHLGVYTTLATAYITVATVRTDSGPLIVLYQPLMWCALLAFMLAGLAGGIIASSITQTTHRTSNDFLAEKTGPFRWPRLHWWTARSWTEIEHSAFWFGVTLAVLSFVLGNSASPKCLNS